MFIDMMERERCVCFVRTVRDSLELTPNTLCASGLTYCLFTSSISIVLGVGYQQKTAIAHG